MNKEIIKEAPRLMVPRSFYKSPFNNGYLELWMPELADEEELEMFENLLVLVVRQQHRQIALKGATP